MNLTPSAEVSSPEPQRLAAKRPPSIFALRTNRITNMSKSKWICERHTKRQRLIVLPPACPVVSAAELTAAVNTDALCGEQSAALQSKTQIIQQHRELQRKPLGRAAGRPDPELKLKQTSSGYLNISNYVSQTQSSFLSFELAAVGLDEVSAEPESTICS